MERYHDHITGKGGSAIYANRELMAVEAFWRWCRDEDTLRAHVEEFRPMRKPQASPAIQPDAPTWEEVDELLVAVRGSWLERFVLIARATGLRGTQIMHLRWEHVDLEEATLTIAPGLPGSKSRHERLGRVVPLAPVLVEDMATWGVREGWLVDKTIRKGVLGKGRILPDKRVTPTKSIRRLWGLTDVRPGAYRQPIHCFRKMFETQLYRAGVAPLTVGYLTGRTGGVQADRYFVWTQMEDDPRAAVALVPAPSRPNIERLSTRRNSR